MQSRYQSLQLRDALSRRKDYQEACRELRCILRGVYVYASKPLLEMLHRDVQHAFRMLSGMENSRQLEAATALLHTVEGLFPEEKRASAALEYTTAVAAREPKMHKDPELSPSSSAVHAVPELSDLSRDLLLHVFKSLDARSLATAAAVCKEWNDAATEDTLWQTQFSYVFGSPFLTVDAVAQGAKQDDPLKNCWNAKILPKPGVWRKAFNSGAQVHASYLLTSMRARCVYCKKVLWLAESAWKPVKGKCVVNQSTFTYHSARPMSVSQVVMYLVSNGAAGASDLSATD